MTMDLANPRLLRAAAATAQVLPSAVPLAATQAQNGSVALTAGYAAAAVADTQGPGGPGQIAILVGRPLAAALAGADGGALDVGAAVQPALDAAARALGLTVGAARAARPDTVGASLGYPFVIIPLSASPGTAALLISEKAAMSTAVPPNEHNYAAAPTPTAVPTGPVTPGIPAPGGQSVVTMPPVQRPAARMGDPESVLSANGAPAGSPTTGAVHPTAVQAEPRSAAGVRGIGVLSDVVMEVTVEIGRTRMSVKDLLALTPGQVVGLDRAVGAPADFLVNGRLIARGEIVVVDEDFGLRVTEVVRSVDQAGALAGAAS